MDKLLACIPSPISKFRNKHQAKVYRTVVSATYWCREESSVSKISFFFSLLQVKAMQKMRDRADYEDKILAEKKSMVLQLEQKIRMRRQGAALEASPAQ